MAFRTFNSLEEAADYASSLDSRWPERAHLQAHLSAELAPLNGSPAHVVELCPGAGTLAARLLADYPPLHYTGFDSSPMLLNLARQRLAGLSHRATLIEADLNQDEWLARLPKPIAAFVSFQSLHDLGGPDAVARIHRLVHERLAPVGKFVYVDLLAPTPPDPAANPGRLTVACHLESLTAAGFHAPRCTLELGPFGCFTAAVR
jgi:SAM-dependent methyltransferase